MKVFAISDLHLSSKVDKPMTKFGWAENYFEQIKKDWNKKVGLNDIVVVAGDLSWATLLDDAKPDIDKILELPGKKVIIRGNHDYWWSSYSKIKGILDQNCYAIQNNAIKIGKYIFFGTRGWSLTDDSQDKTHNEKIYRREVLRLEQSTNAMTKLKTDNECIPIGIMHYPPLSPEYKSTPFTEIFDKHKIQKVIYGHIHNYVPKGKRVYKHNDTEYHLTSCDILQNKLTQIY